MTGREGKQGLVGRVGDPGTGSRDASLQVISGFQVLLQTRIFIMIYRNVMFTNVSVPWS